MILVVSTARAPPGRRSLISVPPVLISLRILDFLRNTSNGRTRRVTILWLIPGGYRLKGD